MFKIQWTAEAEQDLEDLLLYYVDRAGLRVAEVVYTRIREQVARLRTFPESARPGRVPGTRECVISRLPYIAVIEVGSEIVTVLSLVHTARKYPPDS
jgi:plasmid stabilization system protein ParE